MATILILLILNLGSIQGVYLGEFDSPKACEIAKVQADQALVASGALEAVEAAGLLCVPKQEA